MFKDTESAKPAASQPIDHTSNSTGCLADTQLHPSHRPARREVDQVVPSNGAAGLESRTSSS
jgi:hypothetical protein